MPGHVAKCCQGCCHGPGWLDPCYKGCFWQIPTRSSHDNPQGISKGKECLGIYLCGVRRHGMSTQLKHDYKNNQINYFCGILYTFLKLLMWEQQILKHQQYALAFTLTLICNESLYIKEVLHKYDLILLLESVLQKKIKKSWIIKKAKHCDMCSTYQYCHLGPVISSYICVCVWKY